jgi:hypothetical protein
MPSAPKGLLRVLAWFDDTDDELKALINDNGRMPISLDEQNKDINTQLLVYDSSAWVKSPIIFGYSAMISEMVNTTSAGGGTESLNHSTVPEGEVWVITAWNAFSVQGTAGQFRGLITGYGDQQQHFRTGTITAQTSIEVTTPVILKEDGYLVSQFRTCAVGEVIYSNINGFKMKVNM